MDKYHVSYMDFFVNHINSEIIKGLITNSQYVRELVETIDKNINLEEKKSSRHILLKSSNSTSSLQEIKRLFEENYYEIVGISKGFVFSDYNVRKSLHKYLKQSIKDNGMRILIVNIMGSILRCEYEAFKNYLKLSEYIISKNNIENLKSSKDMEGIKQFNFKNYILLEYIRKQSKIIDKLIHLIKENKIECKNAMDLNLKYYLYALERPVEILAKYLSGNLKNGEHVNYNYVVEDLNNNLEMDEVSQDIKNLFNGAFEIINGKKYGEDEKVKIR